MEFLILFYFLLSYGPTQIENGNIQQIEQTKQVDVRYERLDVFFESFNSPFRKYSSSFVEVADKYGLDYRLLASVSCVESSCGKNYKNNAFGWDSDRVDFGPDVDDLDAIANKITTLSYYKEYKRSGRLQTSQIENAIINSASSLKKSLIKETPC